MSISRLRAVTALIIVLLAPPALAGGFTLTSPTVVEGQALPVAQVLNGFGCSGGNRSPALSWSSPPAGTRSFAVTLYDPDAPTGSGWWHWVVFNIPGSVRHLDAGAGSGAGLPAGAIQGRNDFGVSAFGGACPPPGKAHRYVLTVYALKVAALNLDAAASGAMVGFMIHANSLGHASITATYGR